MKPREALSALERFRQAVAVPVPFYADRLAEYRQTARSVLQAAMINLRPPDIDAAMWEGQVASVSARVVTLLFTEVPGMKIGVQSAVESANPTNPGGFVLRGIGVGDVERFVEAGRTKSSPDEPGKNLTEMDAGKSDLQITWRILYALKLNKPGSGGLEEAIKRFMGADVAEHVKPHMESVLRAWFDVFSAKAPEDWAKWIAEQFRLAAT